MSKIRTEQRVIIFSSHDSRRSKTAGKRKAKHVSDDDDDESDGSDENSSDEEKSGAKSPSSRLTSPRPGSDDEQPSGGEGDGKEDLGRGARTRAKVCISYSCPLQCDLTNHHYFQAKAHRQSRRKVKVASSLSEE